jgi:hypothetical protein
MPAPEPPAVGEAGGFNAVQKLLTTTSAATLFGWRVTGIEPALSAWEPNLIRRIYCVRPNDRARPRTPREAATSREFPQVRARVGHGSGTGATPWTRTERSSVRFR